MRIHWIALLALALGLLKPDSSLHAASKPPKGPRILKVLPHFVDLQGRIALSPSLYERDAYQAVLRRDPSLCSSLRYDVLLSSTRGTGGSSPLTLKLELRIADGSILVQEQEFVPKRFRRTWASVALHGDSFAKAGGTLAWRASLWSGTQLLSDQTSFLW